jgi:hypothetical protein
MKPKPSEPNSSLNVIVLVFIPQRKLLNSPPDITPKVSPIDWAYSKTVLCKKLYPEDLVHLRARASKCPKMP